MPGPHPKELRDRVVAAYLGGEGTYEEVAARFRVGEASVDRWVSRFRATGSLAPKPMGGNRNGKFDTKAEGFLARLVREKSDRTRDELVILLRDHGLSVSPAAVQRALERLNLTRKKRRSMRPSGTQTA